MEFRRRQNMIYATIEAFRSMESVGVVTDAGTDYTRWLGSQNFEAGARYRVRTPRHWGVADLLPFSSKSNTETGREVKSFRE